MEARPLTCIDFLAEFKELPISEFDILLEFNREHFLVNEAQLQLSGDPKMLAIETEVELFDRAMRCSAECETQCDESAQKGCKPIYTCGALYSPVSVAHSWDYYRDGIARGVIKA